MSKYRRYERYKDSGVEWIGEIPEEWEVTKLKRCFKVLNGKEIEIETDSALGINVYGSGGVFKKTEKYLFKDESVLFGRKGTIGKPIYVNEPFWTVDTMYYTKYKEDMIPKWFYYMLNIYPWEAYTTQTALPSIVGSEVENDVWAIPSYKEQYKIVNFLDKKTAEIDALIADKEKLIELLQEKRQAIISEAVTKGLNPNVRMKDSGVDWIGEIPEHWEVNKIKYLTFLKSGENITSEMLEEQGDYPVYGGNGLRGYTTLYTHEGNYVLIGRQGALCGNINYAQGKFWASEHAVVVTPLRDVDLIWLGELLRSMNLNQYSISAAQPGLSVSNVQNLFIPVPPYREQCSISYFLKQKIVDIEEIIQDTREQIIKLKEYRQSLISEAVTGKIDVRDYKVD